MWLPSFSGRTGQSRRSGNVFEVFAEKTEVEVRCQDALPDRSEAVKQIAGHDEGTDHRDESTEAEASHGGPFLLGPEKIVESGI